MSAFYKVTYSKKYVSGDKTTNKNRSVFCSPRVISSQKHQNYTITRGATPIIVMKVVQRIKNLN